MTRLLKPIPGLPVKLLAAIKMIGDRNVSLPLPVSIPQAILSAATALLVQPTGRLRLPLVDTIGWRHGGINE